MTDLPSAELLARYRNGDGAAAEELFARYADRLTRLARSRLSRRLAARVDAEDVLQSAYRSFFRLAGDGEVVSRQSGDLWRLLVRITLRKVCRTARRHRAACRSIDREQADLEEVLSAAPDPADAAALVDELRNVLAPLGPVQRRIVELRLQGHEVDEIATAVQRSARTVRRTLAGLGEELERRLAGPPPPGAPGALIPYADVVLQRQLGEGGMGKVYKALWRGTMPVAVKLLRKPLRGHDRAAARFLQEAEVLARLRHPGIVSVHGVGLLPDGGHFLVMDLVDGADLGRRLAAGPISVAEALAWVSDAACALEYAHGQGVIHCDLKPSNLLLGADNRVRVSDFGLARSLSGGAGEPAGGTAGFLAPEQADPARGPISPRTDVHGLGAVLYTLLAGRPPYSASEEPHRPMSLAVLRPDLPGGLAAVCERCLAADPRERPASAAELAEALRALVAGWASTSSVCR